MRATISLLVLLLSMCGVQTERHGTDASTQDVSTELKELRDLVVDLRAMKQRLAVSESKVEVLEADNVAMKQRLAASESKIEALQTKNVGVKGRLVVSESKVEALERALQDTEAEMRMEMDKLKKENAAQEAELTAVKTRLAATETEVENLEKEIKAAPKVAFSVGLGHGYTEAGKDNDLNLVFKRVITNVGQAYSSTTGFFTAPVRGVYYFRFTVRDYPDRRSMNIKMSKNGGNLMTLYRYDDDGKAFYLSSGLTLQLEKGDTVNMVLPSYSKLYNNGNSCTFSGFLLFPL